MLIEAAAKFNGGHPSIPDTAPAWQTQGMRAVLHWTNEERDAERWRNKVKGGHLP